MNLTGTSRILYNQSRLYKNVRTDIHSFKSMLESYSAQPTGTTRSTEVYAGKQCYLVESICTNDSLYLLTLCTVLLIHFHK